MNAKIHHFFKKRKNRIERRLDKKRLGNTDQPMFTASNIHYEYAERTNGIAHGGIGAFHRLARRIGLIDAIDQKLHVLKIHLPYHESDHVLNLAYNALCDGTCLQDLELRRQDENYLDALGARRIPDPTTAVKTRYFFSAFAAVLRAATAFRFQVGPASRAGPWGKMAPLGSRRVPLQTPWPRLPLFFGACYNRLKAQAGQKREHRAKVVVVRKMRRERVNGNQRHRSVGGRAQRAGSAARGRTGNLGD